MRSAQLAKSSPAKNEIDLTPSTDQVFINCPFDGGYAPTFDALVFAIYACGFRPRCALEMDDAGETRIDKLYGIIEQCRYGIHDLSRTQLDPVHGLPRFNMPLELGIFLGAKRFGTPPQRQKRALVLDVERYRFQRFVSDLAGMDIHDHNGDLRRVIRIVRDWLANVSRRKLPGHAVVLGLWDRFAADRPELAIAAGLDSEDLPYADYERLLVAWLQEQPPGV